MLSNRQLLDRFAPLWAANTGAYFGSRWMGIQTLQNPMDLWVIQEILYEVQPDVIIEAGTHKGGSALLWALLLDEIKPGGRVITIDIEDEVAEARDHPRWQQVDFLLGSSTDPAIVEEVKRRVSGKRTLVILDSLHTRDHVLGELRAYAPLVSSGSYVIVQDTGVWKPIVGREGGWASDAVEIFLRENAEFEVDASRERFLLTNCPRGFLRRS